MMTKIKEFIERFKKVKVEEDGLKWFTAEAQMSDGYEYRIHVKAEDAVDAGKKFSQNIPKGHTITWMFENTEGL